jgi:alpha-glucosidase
MEVEWRDAAGRELGLVVRAYDDGVAFRYRVLGTGKVELSDERTAFRLAEDPKAFALPLQGFRTAYEASYRVARVSGLGETLIGLPLTLEFSRGKWAAITEAHLDGYAGLYLAASADERAVLRTRLSRRYRGAAVVREAPFETPWRVVLLGRSAGDLIESDLVLNCNPPCAIEDPSWIKPGKVAWDWWSKQMVSGVDFEGGMNTATMKHYAAFAAEAGFEYLLIDEGWSWWENVPDDDGKIRRVTDITRTVPSVDLPEILDFCERHGVRVWLWLTWGHCAAQMAEAFPLYEKWGIAGVKLDFMNADDQRMADWYHEVAELAAKHHLMVDMHGAYKPTGIRRTWPNMMTREGVKGLEHAKWSADVTPEHNLLLPFTRMLAGPMDYTPGGFNVTTRERFKPRDSAPFVMGTRCHQLAQYVVYESPIQMCVDYPEAYRGQAGFDYLRWVPTTWDESMVLDGYPGRFIAMARRRGETWFLGCMANGEARTVHVPLGFLGEGRWRLDAFADGPRAKEVPEQVRRIAGAVGRDDTLEVSMAPDGGYAARLTPD